jgi:hypothetical protein
LLSAGSSYAPSARFARIMPGGIPKRAVCRGRWQASQKAGLPSRLHRAGCPREATRNNVADSKLSDVSSPQAGPITDSFPCFHAAILHRGDAAANDPPEARPLHLDEPETRHGHSRVFRLGDRQRHRRGGWGTRVPGRTPGADRRHLHHTRLRTHPGLTRTVGLGSGGPVEHRHVTAEGAVAGTAHRAVRGAGGLGGDNAHRLPRCNRRCLVENCTRRGYSQWLAVVAVSLLE